MNVIRFSDLCLQGKVKGQRVFIRADLNVPQNDVAISRKTRAFALLCPAFKWPLMLARPSC